MVLAALAGGLDRGKQGGGLDPSEGVWSKTCIAARASPLILIGLKTRRGCAGGGGQ